MELKFYRCEHCGNIIVYLKASGVPVVCCGEKMKELIPGTVEAAVEKHIPVVTKEGSTVTVKVGSVEHPSTPEHYIEWIVLQTKNGNQRKVLQAGDQPVAEFALMDQDEVVTAFAYCNLHGLWKAD